LKTEVIEKEENSMMKLLRTSWMAGLGCLALLATLALANTPADKKAERRSKAGKQVERKGKVIEADRQVERQSTETSKAGGPVISTNACPDPAAVGIEFTILSRRTQFKGRVRIEGVVRNLGRAAFQSRPGQQTVQLYEVGIGGGRPKLVAEKSFTSLLPQLVNEKSSAALASPVVRVQYERDWDSRSPNLGEFPPSYRLVIVYDPDIRLDGNKQNDDCNMGNNSKERSGADINRLFRQ